MAGEILNDIQYHSAPTGSGSGLGTNYRSLTSWIVKAEEPALVVERTSQRVVSEVSMCQAGEIRKSDVLVVKHRNIVNYFLKIISLGPAMFSTLLEYIPQTCLYCSYRGVLACISNWNFLILQALSWSLDLIPQRTEVLGSQCSREPRR